MSRSLRVLIVADDLLARAGLAALLTAQGGCTVVGQLHSSVFRLQPPAAVQEDVLLWDLGWEGDAALEPRLEQQASWRPLLVLSPDAELAAAALQAGAQGVLLRQVEPEPLVAALQAVSQGLTVLDPDLAAALLPAGDRTPDDPVEALTPREQEVLQLLAEGLTNKAIASRLQISEHTVKFHVNAILGKLGAQSRTEAVVRATRMGLLLL